MTKMRIGSVLVSTSLIVCMFFVLNLAQDEYGFSEVKSEPCVCVPFYQCSDDTSGEVLTDGRFLLDQRMDKLEHCPGHFDVCCSKKKIKPKLKKKNTRQSQSPPVTFQGVQKCGYHEEDVLSWAASVLYQKPDRLFPPSYKCGASIIHQDVVLTAAHCLEEEGHYFIKIGESTRRIYSITIHPEFEMGSLRHDIAVLTLKKMDAIPDEPKVACIPPKVDVPHDAQCIAATFNGQKNTLEKVYIPYVDPQTCTERLRTTRLGKFFELHESFVCAGGSDTDTCVGDGGFPLICPVTGETGRYNQIGIVSWGIGCGTKGIPGVYVNITHVRDWIDGVMEDFGKDAKVYKA